MRAGWQSRSVTAQSETASWTIRRVLQWTQQRFVARGLGSPRLDAELLLGHSLGWPRVALYTHYDQPLSADELGRYRELIKRRLLGEPVAYLTGQKEFYSLLLHVTDAVLIPRPETELLVDVALSLLPPRPASTEPAEAPPRAAESPEPAPLDAELREQQVRAEPGVALTVHYEIPPPEPLDELVEPAAADSEGSMRAGLPTAPAAAARPARAAAREADATAATATAAKDRDDKAAAPAVVVADVGTGSGAVALAIKHSRPEVRVLAIDQCAAALQVAAGNAERLGLPIELFHGDLLTPLPPPLRLDLITANLPYIPSVEIAHLSPEVRTEPLAALDGGPDGLWVIRRLIAAAPLRLRRGGALALEIGAGQHEEVAALLQAAGFIGVQSHRDLAQIERVVSGRLP